MKASAIACASPSSTLAASEPAAPKARRQNCSRAEAVFALQHLEPVDDGAGGADQIVANARAQEGGKIERIERDG
jgi:hypothetical protein